MHFTVKFPFISFRVWSLPVNF